MNTKTDIYFNPNRSILTPKQARKHLIMMVHQKAMGLPISDDGIAKMAETASGQSNN